MDYRRVRVAGGCYFFTLTLADRKSDLLIAKVDLLRAAIKTVKAACRLGSKVGEAQRTPTFLTR